MQYNLEPPILANICNRVIIMFIVNKLSVMSTPYKCRH